MELLGEHKRNIVVIYSSVNKPGKHDATGAFIPEGKAFQKLHDVAGALPVDCINTSAASRRDQVLQTIHTVGHKKPIDGVAFFGHGWPRGIQFGFQKPHVNELAEVISNASDKKVSVVLYACSAAENDIPDRQIQNLGPATEGGFAHMLAKSLGATGLNGYVDAHKTRGHTTWNPYVIRFINGLDPRPTWLVEPHSEYWRPWARAVRDTDLRFQFPFMSELEIKTKIS